MNNSAENSSPEDVGSRSSTYESVAKGVENRGDISDASVHYDNADFGHFIEEYTARVTEAGAEFWKNMPADDRAVFCARGFGENYRPNLGTISDGHFESDPSEPRLMQYPVLKKACNTSKRMACPKIKKSCAKPKPLCPKPKAKVAKKCPKPKPKKVCPKPKPVCPKRKAKKVCQKPKPKPKC